MELSERYFQWNVLRWTWLLVLAIHTDKASGYVQSTSTPETAPVPSISNKCGTPRPTHWTLFALSSSSSSSSNRVNGENDSKTYTVVSGKGDIISSRKETENNGTVENEECMVGSTRKARTRQPSFPASAYSNLAEEEKKLGHNYISFIDQSVLQQYSQQTRLIEPRRYAIPDQFLKDNANKPPTVDDVAMPATQYGPIAVAFAWNGLLARAVVGSASYLAFPLIIDFLDSTVTYVVDANELSKLVDSFVPGVAIVLGTYFSLTISILYDRLAKLTEAVDAECSLLALTLINLLHLFAESDPEAAVEGSQCIADQVRKLVFESRGRETVGIIYNDPYARVLRLLKDYSNQDGCQDGYLLSDLHSNVGKLFKLRSDRLTVESLGLAPTHFDVMTFLSGLLLVGFALGTVATASVAGVPSETAQVLFAALVVCYTIFYEMAFDLNRPYDGIYQLRRSGAAMHLLQIKQILTTHPVVKGRVDFEEILDTTTPVDDCDGNCQQRKAEIWYN
jgi:hypothetical protein